MNVEEAQKQAEANLKEFSDVTNKALAYHAEFKETVDAMTKQMLEDDLDAETAAFVICIKALRQLSPTSAARVISQIGGRYAEALQFSANATTLQLESLKAELNKSTDTLDEAKAILLRKNEELREELGEPLTEIDLEDSDSPC